jgi:hypothetical protein
LFFDMTRYSVIPNAADVKATPLPKIANQFLLNTLITYVWRSQFKEFAAILIVASTQDSADKILVESQNQPRGDEDLTVLVTTGEKLTQQGVLSCVWRKAGTAGAGEDSLSLEQLVGVSIQ